MSDRVFHLRRSYLWLACMLPALFLWLTGCSEFLCTTHHGRSGFAPLAANADWPARVVGEESIKAVSDCHVPMDQTRRVLRYEHEPLREWGYPAGEKRYFSVILPAAQPRPQAPLLVYLHSAGGGGEVQVPFAVSYAVQGGPDFYGLAVNCAPNTPEWWWGYDAIRAHKDLYQNCPTPTEARVMATVEWVARQYKIDRNRIYLTGHSMGGSGSLGIGLCRGDVFASIMTGVPAWAEHCLHRMNFPHEPLDTAATTATQAIKADYARRVSAAGLPDPPPTFNFFSQADGYAVGQDVLMRLVQDGRIFMCQNWGPQGHATPDAKNSNPAIFEFPWMTLRRNEAYPVFTHASTDDHYPGLSGKGPDQAGQVNAYFRWKTLADTRRELTFELRLVRADELRNRIAIPAASTVDVTPRRLQQFRLAPGRTYQWRLEREAKTAASGTATPDSVGLLTIPRLTITTTPARLHIK